MIHLVLYCNTNGLDSAYSVVPGSSAVVPLCSLVCACWQQGSGKTQWKDWQQGTRECVRGSALTDIQIQIVSGRLTHRSVSAAGTNTPTSDAAGAVASCSS